MREAGAVLAGKSPVMPEAGKDAVFVLVITDWAAEMTTDVAQRLDLPFIFIEKDIVVIDPSGELAGSLEFVKRSQILVTSLPSDWIWTQELTLAYPRDRSLGYSCSQYWQMLTNMLRPCTAVCT
jgi:hypothetical protein